MSQIKTQDVLPSKRKFSVKLIISTLSNIELKQNLNKVKRLKRQFDHDVVIEVSFGSKALNMKRMLKYSFFLYRLKNKVS